MSNTSPFYENKNNNVMFTQGGEKKVMKKILSVALSTAMAFSMFASVAFGDTAVSPQDKFDELKAKGIFAGYSDDGLAHLDADMTRAEFAKIITKIMGLQEITDTYTYKDAGYDHAKNWAARYIEAVTAAGVMEGNGNGLFNQKDNVTVQEMATVLVKALKLPAPKGAVDNNAAIWAKDDVQSIIESGLGFVTKDTNFQANATRSLLVEAAFAADALLNKVITSATKVESVTAGNLKEIVVAFDGNVDATSAGDADNYSITNKNFTFDSATVASDKKSVTLLLANNGGTLTNQQAFELVINNVKNEDSTKTFSTKVSFTPSDVTVPTVKEVTALGVKAIKVKFSEPVSSVEALKIANYRIDGAAIAASVTYSYPDSVILTTNVTEGAHTLTVSNVTDFSGLTLVPVTNAFTATIDTAAPTIVSVSSVDLKKVVVTFDEPIKRVDSSYVNISGKTPNTITINDNEVTLNFTSNPLNYSENTIYLKGVRDYSDNTADLETKVTPTLDVTRPEVVSTSVYAENGSYYAKLKFSESLLNSTVINRSNYVLKNANGDIADLDGTNAAGNPLATPTWNASTRTVSVDLGANLSGVYTLTVSNLQDNAYVPNYMLPYVATIDSNVAAAGEISRVWVENNSNGTKYVYVQFNKAISTSGAGNALDIAKYAYSLDDASYVSFSEIESNIVAVATDTIRITTTKAVTAASYITASYIANADGEYLTQGTSYVLKKQASTNVINLASATSATVTGDSALKLVFNGALSYVNMHDFVVTNGTTTVTPIGYTLSSDSKTLYLKYDGNLPVAPAGLYTVSTNASTVTTQDSFGNKVVINGVLQDGIAPTIDSGTFKVATTATAATYNATLTLSEAISSGLTGLPTGITVGDLFTVKVNGNDAVATVTAVASGLNASNVQKLTVTFTYNGVLKASDRILLNFNANYTKAYTDGTNSLAGFTVEGLYGNLQ